MRRALVMLPWLLLVGTPARAEHAAPVKRADVLAAQVPLPTSYFVPCGDCRAAGVAWIAGPYGSVEKAQAVAERRRSWAPGYPLVAHASELGVKRSRGVVVVLGLFEDAKAARTWQSAARGAKLVELGHWPEDPEIDGYRLTRVVRIGSKAAAVYAEADIDYETPRSRLTPLCTLTAGSMYLMKPDEFPMFSQWVPARCANGKRGYVYKTDTWLDTAVVRQSDDTVKVLQTTHVVCDMDTVDEWLWVDGERKAISGWAYDLEGNASGGCGAY